MSRKTRVLGWLIALCGLWEAGDIAAPFVPGFGTVPAFVWNHILAGIVLMIAGGCGATTSKVATARSMDAVAALAGAWLVIASFVLGNPITAPRLWNDIAVGVIVVGLASASWLLLPRHANAG